MNIVSFYAPRPEHPFFQDYTPFLALLRESCARYGHRHIVLTDNATVAEDAYVAPLPRPLMYAVLAAQLAYLSDPQFADVPTLLVGADCVLARDPVVFEDAANDIVITTDDGFADCRMNTGAIYIPRPCVMAPVWQQALGTMGDAWGDDQRALYAAIQVSGWSVGELPCDPYNLAPETPSEDCSRGVVLHFRGPRKRWMIDYCHKHLGLGAGITVMALPNGEDKDIFANVRVNSRRDVMEVAAANAHDGHAVLVGGGPSLAETLPEIVRRQNDGQAIFAMNGAARWLALRGVMADFCVILDHRQTNTQFVQPMAADRYLLASQCDPAVFDAASGQPVSIWHFATPGIADCLPDPETVTTIGGGLTVGLTAMALAFAMGYRKLHLYGYDSSDREGVAHAYPQGQNGPESKRVEVWCAGKPFTCGIAMYAQAETFPRWAAMLADQGAIITVHGDGLLPTVARHMMAAAPYIPEGALL